jgi:autophagy-related protein 11
MYIICKSRKQTHQFIIPVSFVFLPQNRVDEFQRLLSELTGTPPGDQILTYEGAPLSSTNLLSEYGLCDPSEGEKTTSKHVFLYSRALLRHDAEGSGSSIQLQTLPELPKTHEPTPEDRAPHPLDTAPSPLLRALPEYHRQFQQHLWEAEAAAEASAARVALCCRLVNECDVQAMAVDAAMSSAEPHYEFICNAQAAFQEKFSRKFAFHQDVLSSFDADVEFLCEIELPEQLHYGTISNLSDLVDLQQLKTIANECWRSHRRFAARVSELETLHAALRTDVETLFLRAPCVELDYLSQRLATAAAGMEEQATIVQALAADLRKAETATAEASSSALSSSSMNLQDTVGMLEAMHESHMTTALPTVAQQKKAIEEFAQQCIDAKNALAADALHTLRTVASQQSKIREMKEAFVPFPAALERQDDQISSLLVVRRTPALFKQALAECLRRAAFAEKYSSFAKTLEAKMGEFRLKEENMRNTFTRQVEGQLPAELLTKMGLAQSAPVCTVHVPEEEVKLLLPVTPEDLKGMQLPRYGSIGISSSSRRDVAAPQAVTAPQPPPPESSTAASSLSSSSSLHVQNVQLRAELASQREEAEREAEALKQRILELEMAVANLGSRC